MDNATRAFSFKEIIIGIGSVWISGCAFIGP